MDVKSIDSMTSTYQMPGSEHMRVETRAVDSIPEDKSNVSVRDKTYEEDVPLSEKEQQRRITIGAATRLPLIMIIFLIREKSF